MINFSNGISATYYAARVNPQTWSDTEEIPIISGSITKKSDSDLVGSTELTTAAR